MKTATHELKSVTELAAGLLDAGHHPFDQSGFRWALRWGGPEATRDPLKFIDLVISAMLAEYDRRATPFPADREMVTVCFGPCGLPDAGCEFDFGGAVVRHVALGQWSADGTIYNSRKDAERTARRIAALRQLARDLGLDRKEQRSERVG
jgi:hypothetical protein